MAHSNRLLVHWLFLLAEVALFIAASVCAYLSQVSEWMGFIVVSGIATALFAAVKIARSVPALRELFVREDFASKIAIAAGTYGVREYFNMQSAKDQALRNERTQQEIQRAQHLWLCANSGASFLDPAVYRHWQFVEQRLKAGTEFRVVLLDPYSGEKAFRNQINVSGEQLDSKVNISNLIKLHNTYPGLEIRFAAHGMHASVFATENCVFFDPYQVGVVGDRIENRSFALRIEPTQPLEGIGLYRLFKSHFETLWRSSTSFSDWIVQANNKLPAGLPIFKPR
ncbi:MAG: hypothetical protein IPK29_03965 [Betaproteobacteria bacterium]|nr:hypothetical protein [Betaproteobacteria bacterium]